MLDPKALDHGDRRQLTVLFCDIVGSTRWLEELDAEDWSYALREYHATCHAIIARFDGHIAQYLGDGFLAYFGYPTAHENNPHRAIKSALEILGQRDAMNARIRSAVPGCRVDLALRVAVHTGVAVVDNIGERTSSDRIALGIVPTIAARLQQEARENTVIISEATHRLVREAFQFNSVGPFTFKGFSKSQRAYEVECEREPNSRFSTDLAHGLTPFVGREAELSKLQTAWQEVQAGAPRLVLIEGEPGIGKSRLMHEFRQRQGAMWMRVLHCHCSSYARNSAYLPIIHLIRSMLAIHANESDASQLDRIERALAWMDGTQGVPLLARLLSVASQSAYPEQQFAPAQEKQQLHELLVAWMRHETAATPLLLLIEDLHWIDPSSLELLDRLIAAFAGTRMLIIASFRPEFRPSWTGPHVRSLALGPLPRVDAEEMVKHLQGDRALEPLVVKRLITSTDGVPLFLEESTLLALQGDIDAESIPATLQDLLTAKLDLLGSSRELAQLAATVGLEFSYPLLQAVAPFDEPTLQSHLEQLVRAGLIRANDGSMPASYSFKHALVRDAAYQSMMTRARRTIHAQIGDALSERFPEIARHHPELVAHHYTEAGRAQQAVDQWQKAGLRAAERYELSEAVQHLRKGLAVLSTLPASPSRQQQELELQAALAGRLIATEGYGATGVETIYTRALELASELNDAPRRLQMMLGLQSFHFMRANFQIAHQLANECMTLARQVGGPSRELVIHWALGELHFHQGDHVLSEAHLGECMRHYRRSFHRPRTLQDPAVMSWSYCSWTHWLLGYPDRALRSANRALSLAEELEHPFSIAVAYSFTAGLHLFRGELELALERANKAIDLCNEYGFPVWLAFCTAVRGSVRSRQGSFADGLVDIEQGMRTWEASGAVVTTPYYLVLLAEALNASGRPQDALEKLDRAQSIVDRCGERYYEAEVNRVRGDVLLRARTPRLAMNEAEACYARALDISQRQGVKSLALRAAISAARLQTTYGLHDEARAQLAANYHWFTEGINTSDLIHARRILGELVW
jgi:class 3 adenylate cyclase/predicted ATPase